MKTTKRLSDLKVMSADQLQDELLKLKKEQFNLRFQRATGQLDQRAVCPKRAFRCGIAFRLVAAVHVQLRLDFAGQRQ